MLEQGVFEHPGTPEVLRSFLWILILVLCFSMNLSAQDSSCYRCHERERALEETAIHIQEDVDCTDCHGGNPEKGDRAQAHSGDFRGRIAKTELPALCGGCHSDVRRMNPFGIPTDQYSQYLTSKHGEELQQGNTDVAVCTDCHDAHGIRKVRDPRSPVYPKNVPTTCGKCHANGNLMSKYDLPATAVESYLQSVHADLLLKKEDLSAPTCATCHGNHGATPPGFSEIRLVCGKCHIRQQELFAESPHAAASEEGIFESCVTCHSNHKILNRYSDIKNQCVDCHEEGDDAMTRRDSIFAVIRETETEFEQTQERLGELTRHGFHTEDEQVLLEEAKTSVLQLPPVQHTLNLENVQKTASAAQNALSDLSFRLDRMERTERWKKAALIPIWLFLICMAVLFWAKRNQLDEQDESEEK